MKFSEVDNRTPVTILIAEDDPEMLAMLDLILRDRGYEVIGLTSGVDAVEALETRQFDIVLTDIKMPGASGMDVLRTARARTLNQPVILMTAFGSVDSAVEAMKEGAYYYITKPFDNDDLIQVVDECAHQVRLRKRSEELASTEGGDTMFPIVFRSTGFRRVIQLVHEVAPSHATVLITGESGTGKDLIAREIHRRSACASGPFVPVDANAIPENLLESELFGHVRGSFTGAVRDQPGIVFRADGGTLFLDEIGNLNVAMQSKLLRFLQDRKYRRVGESQEREADVRLLTATNADLPRMMKAGTFREDLYYRLSVIHIDVPALRDRREDIAPLAYHFLRKFNAGFRVEGFRPEVLDVLVDFDWPGNVRQLENAVEHAVIMRKAGLIQKRDLPEWFPSGPDPSFARDRSLEAMERNHIQRVLDECEGNQSRAARILGIDRKTLARKLKLIGPGEENGS